MTVRFTAPATMKRVVCDYAGFTLMEMVIVIVIIGVLSAVAIPALRTVILDSRNDAARTELTELRKAIMGDGQDGSYGYFNEVGALPPTLTGLLTRPGGVAVYNPFSRTGWNGPYVDTRTNADGNAEILVDPWGAFYVYDNGAGTERIWSCGEDGVDNNGAGDDIEIAL